MASLNLDQATKLQTLQRRLRAAALQKPDPFDGAEKSASAIAGMVREAANISQAAGYSGDAVRLNAKAQGIFAAKLAGNPWYSIALAVQHAIDGILIKSGFRDVSIGRPAENVAGPSFWEIRDMYGDGSTGTPPPPPFHNVPTGGPKPPGPGNTTPIPAGGIPTTPGGVFKGLAPGPPQPPPTPVPTPISYKARTMAEDSITGVDDPLSDDSGYTRSYDLGADPRYDLWDDIKSGAQWAWDQYKDIRNQPPPSAPGVPPPPPGVSLQPPQNPQSNLPMDPNWWYQQGQALRGPASGSGGGPGDVFPLPQIGGLYDYLMGQGGNGDVNSLCLPAITRPAATARLKAPRGYVIVEIQPHDPLYATAAQAGGVQQPDGSIKVAMDKDKARKRKYWKPRPKPWLTASDRRVLTKANRVERKVAKAYLKAGIGPKDIKEAKNC